MHKKQLYFIGFCLVFVLSLAQISLAAERGLQINNGDEKTYNRRVLLSINLIEDENIEEMRFSEKIDFSDATWVPFTRRKYWLLSYGKGNKTLYGQFRNDKKQVIASYRDSIRLEHEPLQATATLNSGNAITYSLHIPITLTYSNGVEAIAIHENKDDVTDEDFVPAETRLQWILPEGEGQKRLYITFRDSSGERLTLEKKITYRKPKNPLPVGTVLRSKDGSIYYYGHDDRLHLFPSLLVYHSYYSDFGRIKNATENELRQYQIGLPVCMRGGTWLIQFKGEAKVYATLPGCQLQALRSPTEAFVYYGENWGKRIILLPSDQKRHYQVVPLSREEDDRDRDGVSTREEERYGSSDTREDTDGDSVSDYEEVYFWKTNPTRRDTDRDGVSDGKEIQMFRSPKDTSEITAVPDNSYVVPAGSILQLSWYDLKYYYTMGENEFTFLSKTVEGDGFSGNALSADFALNPPLGFPVSRSDYQDVADIQAIRDPHVKFHSIFQPL